ncbi:DUF1190 domain-containing protein [uncultured Methylobacterium sp.]|uniref:DUF1190 domain-containing protein n=1 Tax=uncultured Methylobacterium sp. TaxID=157278 RepID=UPI0025906102|nr:DUF1190 domain-containing protein [uncultured Methylobacterium sp.]
MGDAPGRDPGKDAEAESVRRMKRSATISLVLVAGAGAAAFGLARLDSSQREEDALVYGNVGACIAEGLRKPEDCTGAEAAARRAYAATAPRYETLADCERHHGRGGCVPGATVTAEAQDRSLPAMAGFMLGPEGQDLPAQPLYAHAPEEEREAQGGAHGGSGGHGLGYCTGTGARIVPVSGSSRVHVPTTVARAPATTPRLIARGGFGGTGRAVAAAGGHGTGGHAGGSGG